MYKGINKLARLIKIMAKDVSQEDSWWKLERVGAALGLIETDDFFDEINIKDDSGYRAIIIGDTRGNVSRVNGRRIEEEEHKGYMLLYSENSNCDKGRDIFKYKCFPDQNEIAYRLQQVFDKIPLISLNKNNCDNNEFWYSGIDDETLTYLSIVVKEYADTIEKDKRTPEEIFVDCD